MGQAVGLFWCQEEVEEKVMRSGASQAQQDPEAQIARAGTRNRNWPVVAAALVWGSGAGGCGRQRLEGVNGVRTEQGRVWAVRCWTSQARGNQGRLPGGAVFIAKGGDSISNIAIPGVPALSLSRHAVLGKSQPPAGLSSPIKCANNHRSAGCVRPQPGGAQ